MGCHRASRLAVLALLLTLIGVACRREPEVAPVRPAPVEVVTVTTRSVDEVVHATGSVDAVSSVPIRAQMAGRIERLHFVEGQAIEQGELLVSIDDAELREQTDALRASLDAARARAQESAQTLQRIEPLHEQGIVPDQELDEARSNAATAEAEVGRIRAELRALNERRAFASVRAPFSGRLTQREVNPGDAVQVGDPLVTLVRPGALEINLWISQRDAARVEPGMPVRVRLVTDPDHELLGTLVFVSPELDARTRTRLVKAALDEEVAPELTPGLSASAAVVTDRREGPVIPERALVGTREGYIVFVVEDGTARARPVEIGLREPGVVLVTSGLVAGERVVEHGQQRISDGDAVEVVERRPPGALAQRLSTRQGEEPTHR